MDNPIKIIRYKDVIIYPDGTKSELESHQGTMEEVREYAKRVARENGTEVETII